MKNRKRLLVVGLLLVAVVSTAVLWEIVRPRDPIFRGMPESRWIAGLAYHDEEQVEQWREFGSDGVLVLVRGFEGANRPADRFYRNAYRRMSGLLPGGVMRHLPVPTEDVTRATRVRIASLLSSLGKDALESVPAMSRALDDEDEGVRAIVVTFFNDTEGEDALVNGLPVEQKRQLLPKFIRAMEDGRNWGLRNNAALVLRFFPEERETVVPVLAKALEDPRLEVRMSAAESLLGVDPDAAATEEVVRVVIGILKDPDDQVAYRAAELLGEIAGQPELTVPALIESVQGTNRLVASAAARALGGFPENADVIVPILLQCHQDTNSTASRWATGAALKQIAPEAAASVGVE